MSDMYQQGYNISLEPISKSVKKLEMQYPQGTGTTRAIYSHITAAPSLSSIGCNR